MITANPGFLTPTTRPKRNTTPISYWLTTWMASTAAITRRKTMTMVMTIVSVTMCPFTAVDS